MVNPDVESAERRVEERREWGKNPGADRWVLRFRRDMRERECFGSLLEKMSKKHAADNRRSPYLNF